jgi:hypothetical protein
MMTNTTGKTNTTAETISGRAIGALFFSGFGSLWLCTGLAALHRLNIATGLGVALVASALIFPALRLLERTPKTTQENELAARDLEIKRTFNRVNTVQWIAIIAAVVVLNLLQRPAFIVPCIATIVGLHLFPLARLFRYPTHYVTGTFLVLWSLGVVVLLPSDRIPSVGALGTALVLLLSAAYTLAAATRAAKVVFNSPQ